MIEAWRRLAATLDTGPNRIVLTTALRSTIATMAPLVFLSALGRDADAHLAVIGALGTAMVDVGGPYRNRLAAMGILALAGPVLLLLGALVAAHWWLAAPLVFAVALGSGLIRVIGPEGNSLGIHFAIALLIGISVGGGVATWSGAAAYGGGALWTILVTLALWELRPYRRLEREVAGAWEAVAALVVTVATPVEGGAAGAVGREQRVTRALRDARVALELAHDTLGEMRAGMAGPGTALAQLLVLLNAAARTDAATLTLYEIESRSATDPALQTARREALAALRDSCHAVGRELIAGYGKVDLAALRERLGRLARLARPEAGASAPPEAERVAFAQALRHLESAAETLPLLFGRSHRLPDLLRLPMVNRRPPGVAIAALRAHLDTGSAIFRHAVRIAGVAAVGTAVISRWQLPHGIWLPLTAIAVLQPEYGGTRGRALERTAGTLAGAVVASLLLATLSGTVALDIAIAVLLFATFLLIRRRYGAAMTFLTPLIILLIGTTGADPWLDLGERVAYTLVGALLAIAAAHLLWPQWEHERLAPLLARAIRAERAYLVAVLGALAEPAPAEAAPPDPAIGALRRQAEIDVGNADAAFQRMLAEPVARRRSVARRFALMVFIHRLCRHAIALATHIGAVTLPPSELAAFRQLVDSGLEEIADSLLGERAPAPRPPFDEPLARLRAALAPAADDGTRATVARLLDRIVSATTALNASCAPEAPPAVHPEVGGQN